MTAQVYGRPGKTRGEQLVFQALHALPDDCIIYAEPKIVHRSEQRYPDFVIVYHMWGVIVLEVKDWSEIQDRDRRSAWLPGKSKPETSPVEQARQAAHVLEKMLEQDPDLRGYAGGLDFYYAYGGVLPHLPTSTITWLEQEWGENYLLGRQDLDAEQVTSRLSAIDGFSVQRCTMTEDQVRAVCALLDERNQVRNRVTGEFKGVVDRQQESIAKEAPVIPSDSKPQPMPAQGSLGLDDVPSGDSRSKYLEKEMPEEAAELKRAPHVRLVRGFAGTGKTDVLILRAHYLHEQFPELDILVTTFNHPLWQQRLRPELDGVADVVKFDTLCASIYRKKHGCWRSPVATNGVVAAMAAHNPQVDEFGRDFLTEEFIWMKETERTSRTQYVTGVREGRGTLSRRALSRKMKEQVFDLFEVYEERLGAMPAYDWVDLHDRVRAYLEEGIAPDKRYDVVLVDEAQHFAPTWMSILDHFVKPGGSLFLCDDPSQSVYRYFSWRQKGVEVVGRTRWLQVPYRNTREIFQAAYALIAENPLAQQLLAESAEAVTPELAHAKMRSGQQPQVHEFATWRDEQAFVVAEVNKLVQGGVYPSEIAVLHDEKHVRNKYQSLLPSGVNIYEVRKQTGLEYKVVFVPQVQQMVTRAVGRSLAEEEARNKLKFYMTMTRARDRLYILYTRKWPSCLDGLRSYAEWIHHT